MNFDLDEELDFLDSIIVENQKNYQIWHHRKAIVEKSQNASREKPILNLIFEDEPKNFHAWCHRIWVVRRFNLPENEFVFSDEMLKKVILHFNKNNLLFLNFLSKFKFFEELIFNIKLI
jgi:protein farnesyltransferase/geranylgeranyltransferase type-1 subunit alpha